MPTTRSRKKNRKGIPLFIAGGLLVLTLVVILVLQKLKYRKAKFTHYPQFGINIPEGYSIHGIDVSKYQSVIAWQEVKTMRIRNINPGFAFIKATEGIGKSDPMFARNWRRSKEAGVLRGAYHFFIGSKDGKMQAEHFIDKVDLQPGDFPPVLDIEQMNGASIADLKKEAKRWLDVVEEYYKVRPIIYTNVDFYNRNLGAEFDKYPLWVAHYYQPEQPRIGRDWIFWQHSDRGRVNGITTPVDFNVFNGDSANLKNLLIK